MNEIESIYQIIHDETYKNTVLLDIELGKISDTELVVGMLCDLYAKEGYNADKSAILLSMRNYDIENMDLRQCNAHYIQKMNEYRKNIVKSPSVEKLTQFLVILNQSKKDILDGNQLELSKNADYVEFVKGLTADEFDFFKNILLQQELYEEIVSMESIYNN